jgi:hypothetical protein
MARIGLFTVLGVVACGTVGCGNPPPPGPPDGGFFFGDLAGPSTPKEIFGPTTTSAKAPAPLAGGTMIVLADGHTAAIADPDRDIVYLAETKPPAALLGTVALSDGEQPQQLAEDGARRVHVVLRNTGSVATIDVEQKQLVERRAVCAAPRGIVYEARLDALHVACAGGELVTLPASGGAATRTLRLDDDLRDIVLDGQRLLVSRFRSAEVLVIEADGHVSERMAPQPSKSMGGGSLVPGVAWRMIPGSVMGGVVRVLHQRASEGVVPTKMESGAYGGNPMNCDDGIIHATSTEMTPGRVPTAGGVLGMVNGALDAVVLPDSTMVVVVPGNERLFPSFQVVHYIGPMQTDPCERPATLPQVPGQLAAVAAKPNGSVLVQSREPAVLYVFGKGEAGSTLQLSTVSRADTGRDIFHFNTTGGIACVSCHPDASEDGRVWRFDDIGRRTQTVRGGLLATAPFHWDGAMKDLGAIMSEGFTRRMSGPSLDAGQISALSLWLDSQALAAPSPALDPNAVTRGQALFTSSNCNSCHSGGHFTTNATVDVGTGGSFQVPTLNGVAARAPFLHDGSIPSLRNTFTHGGKHFESDQLDDLVAYIKTL